jgi:hypothetical protein
LLPSGKVSLIRHEPIPWRNTRRFSIVDRAPVNQYEKSDNFMKFNAISIILFAFICSGNIHIYLLILQTSKEINKADRACARDQTNTEQRYLKQIRALSLKLEDQSNLGKVKNAHIKSNLDKMVSYSHMFGAVSQKYEFLLHTVKLSIKDKNELLNFLIEREKLSSVTFQSLAETSDEERAGFASKLTSIEDSIKEILIDPIDYQRYEYLRKQSL